MTKIGKKNVSSIKKGAIDWGFVPIVSQKIEQVFQSQLVAAPDGGPQSYYDFPPNAVTLNDLLEYKGDKDWKGDSFHLANVVKAAWRWGIKSGVDKPYDARKFIYSGARLLLKYTSVGEVRRTLQQMLDDPQFQEKTNSKT